jgi:hypothetical protein
LAALSPPTPAGGRSEYDFALQPQRSLPAALPALTSLRVNSDCGADVSGFTGLRRLSVRAVYKEDFQDPASSIPVDVTGVSRLTALESRTCVECDRFGPLADVEDLAPLVWLTQLVMTCVPPELPSHPLAARLRGLELQAFGLLKDLAGDGPGSGANGAASAALAALASGAPLLERLRICVVAFGKWNGNRMLRDSTGTELGAPLGPSVAWPSLTHLEVTPWAALLLAGCTFPRLSRLVATLRDNHKDLMQTALPALCAKARDHASLLVDVCKPIIGAPFAAGMLPAAAALPGLRHLTWRCSISDSLTAAPASVWARLALTLESLELVGLTLADCGYAEPLAALGLTRLTLDAVNEDDQAELMRPPPHACGGGETPGGLARAARALARLPRLAHLRLAFRACHPCCDPVWGSPAVAAALSRCPALRLLEIDRPCDPLWRHELGSPPRCAGPRSPRPSPAWPPFAEALRAGGCGAVVRPCPPNKSALESELGVEF